MKFRSDFASLLLPLAPSLHPYLISDTLLEVSGPWFQYSTKFPVAQQRSLSLTELGKDWTGSTTHEGDDSIMKNQESLTMCVCVLSPQDCVCGGIPAGEQSSTSFAFLPRVLPGLAEISLP